MEYSRRVQDLGVDHQPTIQIVQQVRFQKFRYYGEDRPGKRNQKKQFMSLQADVSERLQIHPNGLIGTGCHDGLYDMQHQLLDASDVLNIEIPYIRIERMKSRKEQKETIKELLSKRLSYLPTQYREVFESQVDAVTSCQKLDATKVRLAVIVSPDSPTDRHKTLLAVSDTIKDGSEKTTLGILKLSQSRISATTGASVDIFTTEKSPPITAGEYSLYVRYQAQGQAGKLEHWVSQETRPGEDCIIYNKVITYQVPPFETNYRINTEVRATLHLVSLESGLSCTCPFYYIPGTGVEDVVTLAGTGVWSENKGHHDESLVVKKSRRQLLGDEITANVRIKRKFVGEATDQMCRHTNIVTDRSPLKTAVDSTVKTTESMDVIDLWPSLDVNPVDDSSCGWCTSSASDDQKGLYPIIGKTIHAGTRVNKAVGQTGTRPPFEFVSSADSDNVKRQGANFLQHPETDNNVRSLSSYSDRRARDHTSKNTKDNATPRISTSYPAPVGSSQSAPENTSHLQEVGNPALVGQINADDVPLHASNGQIRADNVPICPPGGQIQADNVAVCSSGGQIRANNVPLCPPRSQIRADNVSLWFSGRQIQADSVPLCPPRGHIRADNVPLHGLNGQIRADSVPICPPRGQIRANNVPLCPPRGQIRADNVPLCPPRGHIRANNVPLHGLNGQFRADSVPICPARGQIRVDNVPLCSPDGQIRANNVPLCHPGGQIRSDSVPLCPPDGQIRADDVPLCRPDGQIRADDVPLCRPDGQIRADDVPLCRPDGQIPAENIPHHVTHDGGFLTLFDLTEYFNNLQQTPASSGIQTRASSQSGPNVLESVPVTEAHSVNQTAATDNTGSTEFSGLGNLDIINCLAEMSDSLSTIDILQIFD